MTKAKGELKRLTAGAENLPVFGWLVYWTMAQIEIARSTLEAHLDSTLGPGWLPRKPHIKRAMRQAAIEELTEHGFLRKVRDDAVMAAFALVEEMVDETNLDVELHKKGLVILYKKENKIEVRGGTHRTAEELKAKIESLLERHNADDLRTVVINYIKGNGGLSLRETGGIYFLRPKAAVDALETFVTGLPGNCEFYALPVVDSKTTKAQMGSHVRAEIEREFVLAAEEVKQMTSEDSKTRTSTYDRRLEDFKSMRSKIQMYSDLLKTDGAKLERRIAEMEDEVKQALTSQLESNPAAVEFPYKSRVYYDGSRQKAYGTVIGYPPSWPGYVRVLTDDGYIGEWSGKLLRKLDSEGNPIQPTS